MNNEVSIESGTEVSRTAGYSMLAAERRADAILAPWGLRVSSHSLVSAMAHSCRPGRVARRAALWTLRCVFGLEGRTDMAAFRGTSRGYRRLVAAAGSVEEARRVLAACSPGESDTPRTRLARGLAAVRRLRCTDPRPPLIALAVTRTVECSNNTAWLMSTRRHGADHPYTPLPRWYLRRKEYIARLDASGARTLLLHRSKTQIGICTAWATLGLYIWYVEGPRGRMYRIPAYSPDEAVFMAKQAWSNQRRIARKNRRDLERFLSQSPQGANRTILVRVSDSVATGNCRYGSEQWASHHFAGKSVIPLQALMPYRENRAISRVISAVLEREMSH